MNFYKKAIFVFILFLFFMIVFVKMIEPIIEKQLTNVFADKKISKKLKKELENSTKDFTPERKAFYSNVIKKLYIKWKPLINESIAEAEKELK